MISYFVIIFVMRKWWLWNLARAWLFALPLAFWSLPAKADNLNPQVAWTVLNSKCSADKILVSKGNKDLQQFISKSFEENFKGCLSTEQLNAFNQMIESKEFTDEVDRIKKEKRLENDELLRIILEYFWYILMWFCLLYTIAYASNIKLVLKWKDVSALWFSIFWTSSLWTAFLNILINWDADIESILEKYWLYFLSTSLSYWLVWLHFRNKILWKSYEDPELLVFFENIPLPFSRYNKSWEPSVWNKELEKITWYSKEEVLAYYKEKWEILTLLYEWEELEKVKKYLSWLKEKWWYVDVPFTLKTKSWEKVTLYWTSYPDWKWWRYSFANYWDELLKKMFDDFPHPVSKYDEMWKPLVWNKALEKITWYSHEDVLMAWEEASEEDKKTAIMKLLYKWEDLARVQEHLKKIDDFEKHLEWLWLDRDTIQSKRWYENIAFTMTRKDGEKVTLLWTTMPDWKWWTLRTAIELTNIEDIKRELENTKRILRTDELTKALNLKALKQDLHTLFTRPKRKNDFSKKVFAIIDLDWFKWVNDTLWHNVWDEVLVAFVNYINSKIRAWEDKLYRIWWDEFLLALDSEDIDTIVTKINDFREWFFATEFPYDYQNSKLHVGSSWWIKIVTIDDYRSSGLTEEQVGKIFKDEIKEPADHYMYAVKYFRFILPELEARWLDLSKITEKNWQAYPIFDDEWNFIWVRVIKTWITFDLSVEELELIDKRKKEKADEIADRK